MPDEKIRTRFAPSPTGNLHIGSARTALFAFLFAKSKEGSFVLRIEDTDKERSKPEYEKNILESLRWLGLNWDEGPFRQSERLDIYEKYTKKLLDENKAYYCFCSEEELEVRRQEQLSRGEAPKYAGTCRDLSKEEIEKKLEEGKSSVIRFKVEPKKIKFKDIIKDDVEFDMGLAGDIVIAKSLKQPLFVLAGVIDDFEMNISHVIRGDDHIANTPKQILLQQALEFPQPEYGHFPMILAPDRSKMSKREGATAVSDFKKEGYLPEALVNFLAFLGWNPGDEREIYSLASLIKEFSLEKVQKGGAIFNIQRLDYLNGFYIRQRSIEKLTELCIPYLIEAGLIKEEANTNFLQKAVSLYQERLKKLSEIPELIDFLLKDKLEYDKELLKWKEMTDEEIAASLLKSEKLLSEINDKKWTKENLEKVLLIEAEKIGLPAEASAKAGDRGKLLWPLRVALSGKKASAGPFEIAEILGKEKTLKRIIRAHNILCARPSTEAHNL